MSVLGRLLFASAERLDLPDLLSIDSFVAGDFKFLLKGLVGDSKPLVLRGFDVINPGDAIGSQSLSIRVADSVVMYPGSLAGPFFHGLEEGNSNAQPLVPDLKKNATNFVYLTFSTFDTASDTRAFWDPDLDGGDGGEFTQDVNTESVLQVDVNVSVSAFPENTIPVCKVTVGPSVIESIQDCRDGLFRLGEGGANPNPFSTYNFREDPSSTYARSEPATTITSALDPNPFQGGDKNIQSLKEWMDVVMTKLLELGGSTFWYEDTSSFGMVNLFLDALGRSFKSKGQWEHSSSTPGLLTWTEDIHLKYVADDRDIIIRGANKTLDNEDVMYVELIRGANINTGDVSVEWLNGLDYVNGATGAFENLEKGDWVKKKGDPNRYHRRVEEFFASTNLGGGVTSAALARSIRLSDVYEGVNDTERGEYSKGSYDSSEVFVVARSEADGLNDGKFLDDLGGSLAWLALRSDTVMNISDITTTSLSGIDIEEADGTTAKVTSTGHGLVDGDRITIADSGVGYNGTYVVEVEDANTFYIHTSQTGDEIGVANAYYAIVTTTTREIDGGFEVESAQHGFEDNQTIAIADTSSLFDATYQIKQRSATTFSIPVGSAIGSVATGTATLARINVKSEFGMVEIKQGEATGIGEGDTANIMSFVGMGSIAETNPTYNLPAGYGTLNGQANYNSDLDDNLTVRAAKLTAMMADKSQDKTIKLLLENVDRVTNTQNVLAQDISFTALDGGTRTMHVVLPNSANNGSVTLAGTVSINANQAAYFTIDRNAAFTVASLAALTVADITDVPLDENIFVFAVRLSDQDVWLWDGTLVEDDETRPLSSHIDNIARQDRNIQLVRGGTWDWDLGTTTLTNSEDAYIQIPGVAENRNQIDAQGIVIPNDGDVAYVNINRAPGAPASLTVNIAAISAVNPTADTYIIARRIDDVVIVGSQSDQLQDGESQTLDASASDQTLQFIGAEDEADATPYYTDAVDVGVVESRTVTFPAAAALTTGQYFTINSILDLNEYYVWANIDAGGGDPSPAGLIDVEVNILSTDSAVQVAAKYFTVLDALSDFDITDNLDGTLTVDNSNIGASTDAANVDMGAGFSVVTDVQGAGAPNFVVIDDESLTKSIKRLDSAVGGIESSIDTEGYEETMTVVAGAPADDNEITGPVVALTTVTIPENSRNSDLQESYVVGEADLEVYLNGNRLQSGLDFNEIGAPGADSTDVEFTFQLEVDDVLIFTKLAGVGGGGGGAVDAENLGGPSDADVFKQIDSGTLKFRRLTAGANISITENASDIVIASSAGVGTSTVTSISGADYTILSTDDVVLVSCAGANRTMTLPDASAVPGKIYNIKLVDSGFTMFIESVSSQTLDGVDIDAVPHAISIQYENVTIVSDGSNWFIL